MNAQSTISEAVSKVLAGHESRNPWKNCSCGWRGPTITLSYIVRKGLFQKHVADALADVLMRESETLLLLRRTPDLKASLNSPAKSIFKSW